MRGYWSLSLDFDRVVRHKTYSAVAGNDKDTVMVTYNIALSLLFGGRLGRTLTTIIARLFGGGLFA